MEIELEDMGDVAMAAEQELKISSMCATFAETEVISLRAEGNSKPDVLGAVHQAIASRTLGLVSRVGKKGPVVMTGGVAKNRAAVHYIEKALGLPVILPGNPQVAGALGAALIGLDDYRAELGRGGERPADDDAYDAQMTLDKACIPACRGDPVAAGAAVPAPGLDKAKSLLDSLQNQF